MRILLALLDVTRPAAAPDPSDPHAGLVVGLALLAAALLWAASYLLAPGGERGS